MNRADIVAARKEARRFLDLSGKAMDELNARDPKYDWASGTAVSGALRRASMDLTRSLAKMRGRQK